MEDRFKLTISINREYLIDHRVTSEYLANIGGIHEFVESVLRNYLEDKDLMEGSKFYEHGMDKKPVLVYIDDELVIDTRLYYYFG